jgi:hypothetical protein
MRQKAISVADLFKKPDKAWILLRGWHVIDADTIAFISPLGSHDAIETVTVRVRGVNAPEIRGVTSLEKFAAQAIKTAVVHWLDAASVVEYEISGVDKYGPRRLGDVYADSQSLLQLLLDFGCKKYHGENKFNASYTDAELTLLAQRCHTYVRGAPVLKSYSHIFDRIHEARSDFEKE